MKKIDFSLKGPFTPYILSLILIRISAALITILLFMLINLITGTKLNADIIIIIACAIASLYMGFMIFRRSQQTGLRDYASAKKHSLPQYPLKGLVCGVIAEAPFAILLVLGVILSLTTSFDGLSVVMGLANFHYNWVQMIQRNMLLYLAFFPVLPALSWIGYRIGNRKMNTDTAPKKEKSNQA